VILVEIVKACPDRSKLEQLCNEIVSGLTELLCTAVSEGALKAHDVPDQVNELLHYVPTFLLAPRSHERLLA
jgi:hypothetical protein